MSEYHEIKEHLHIEGKAADKVTGASICADIMQFNLASLASLVLLDEARIYGLQLTADGREYNFSGKEITPEYRTILSALGEAADIDIVAEYGYYWRDKPLYLNVGPFELMDTLDEHSNEVGWDNVFYSAWHNADYNDGCGALVAYGVKDGKTYNGVVPFEKVDAVPEGEWYAQDIPIIASVKGASEEERAVFIAACRDFSAFCDEADLGFYEHDGVFTFCMSNLAVKTDAEARQFMEKVKEVHRLSNESFCLMANMVDLTLKDARLMMIEEDGEDGFNISIAAV